MNPISFTSCTSQNRVALILSERNLICTNYMYQDVAPPAAECSIKI